MLLLKNAEVYSPEPQGVKDILICGNTIASVEKSISPATHTTEEIDLKRSIVVPGFIDCHVHIAGAGGEGGPATRTPEIHPETLVRSGITTVIGCLGTDGITRNIESVLMKAKSLKAEGLSSWMYTGAYQVPVPSITGDIAKDISLIEEIIGVGEVAVSDHRSSCPSTEELIRIASHARIGGMLSGKSGIVNIHMGDAENPFQPLIDVEQHSQLKRTVFLPTHINRNTHIFKDAHTYGKTGYLDITTSSYPYYSDLEIKPSTAYAQLLASGVPQNHITMSSDACGSLPDFDESGQLKKLVSASPESNLREFRDCILNEKLSVEQSLRPFTSNPAAILKLNRKGSIKPDKDADLLILNRELELKGVIANGQWMMRDRNIVHQWTL